MATANPLPKKLRIRLAELGQRLHRMHVVRAICRIVLVMAFAALAAVLFDAAFGFPAWLRGMLFVGWLGLGSFEVRRFVRGPLSAKLDAVGIAAAIEEEFPRLGERLTTAVELAGYGDPANGSPDLVDLVIKDAETRTRKLDLKRAAPATTTVAFSIASILAVFAILLPLVTVPKAAEHARRFFLPWYAPTADVGYKITVTSGDPTVKRGETTAMTALLEPIKSDAVLPTSAIAVVKTERGLERLPMTFDAEKGEGYLTRGPLETDFDYRIVCGEIETEWHHVTVVDPVRLEQSRVTVLPPAYARKIGAESQSTEGLADLKALQHSRITYELRFNRLPSAAWLEWTPESDEAAVAAPASRINISIHDDGTATVTVPAIVNGEFRLHAEADQLRTSLHPQPLRVEIDRPPTFERVTGFTAKAIRPNDKLPIDCTVVDDVGISSVELEYRINDGPVKTARLELTGYGTPNVGGTSDFSLAGLVKEGERFEYRLVAADNRDVPAASLTPQKTYYPKDEKWAGVKIRSAAAPVKEQEIDAAKEKIDARLNAIIEALKVQHQTVRRLKTETVRQNSLKPELVENLANSQNNVHDIGTAIGNLADDIGLTPDLARFADAIREVGVREVVDADVALLQSQRVERADPRTKNLTKAGASLADAIRKLEELRKGNERLAKERLDKQRLDQLAEDQKKLGDQTVGADQDRLDELRRKQKDLEDRLKKLQDDSEPLRDALDRLRARQFEMLGNDAQRLERELRDLTQAMKNVERKTRENRMADLLKKQTELAEKAKKLAEKTDTAARISPISPLKSDEIEKAVEKLKNGNLSDAVDQQEKAAFELDRLAKALEQAIAKSNDPREAAKQLERLQEDLRQKVAEAVKETTLDKLPKERREAFEKRQQAIRKAASKLSIPADANIAKAMRQVALQKTAEATDSLIGNDAKQADEQMMRARQVFAELAEQMPAREKRLAQARAEFAKLKQEQDAIARLAESAVKQVEKQDPDAAATQAELAKKVADLAKRQGRTAEKLRELDVPGHEERREKVERILRQAKDDLDKGRPRDIGASQETARRELERLEQALNGQEPADRQADHLAKKQKRLADAMKRNAEKPDAAKSAELQRQQAEQSLDLQKLQTPEAPSAKDDALELIRKAETAKTPQEAAMQANEAAKAIQRLADQMNGRESEADKADRLAKRQRQAADEADRLTKKENIAEARKKAQFRLEETKDLRAGEDARKEKQKAIEALTRARNANQSEQLAKAEKEAADALRQLADKLAERPVADRPMLKNDNDEHLDGLPNQAQADEARRLAQEQRTLRDELARANEEFNKKDPLPGKNPLEELVKEQEKIAQDAAKLAKLRSDKTEAQQAADAAKQASRQLKNGQLDSAQEAGHQAARQLEQLSQSGKDENGSQEALDLAKRQEALNKKLTERVGDARAAQAQQAERQKDLSNQIGELTRQMKQFAEQMKDKPNGKAEEAVVRGDQAGEAMKQARTQMAKGERDMSRGSQDKAADALKQAADDLADAAKQMAQNPMSPSLGQESGESVQDARDRMVEAQNQLGQGKPKNAGESMRQAADALKQAVQQMSKPGSGNPAGQEPKQGQPIDGAAGNPGGNDGTPQGQVNLSKLGPLGQKYKGKNWGELPGEIKNQIISDFKARYGEDFAKYIKLYFEQLAERK